MAGSKKKKKKRGGAGGGGGSGRRNKGKAEHISLVNEQNEELTEEITALCSIFEEDCRIIPGSHPQIIVTIRPYSRDMGYEDVDVSAQLLVRCLPGYPFKCPKLHITPQKGLTESEADNLLSLLYDQANSNTREGRVMVFNLVEAAQEFLSKIAPVAQLQPVLNSTSNTGQLFQKDKTDSRNKTCSPRGPYVFGFIDLFNGCGESLHWGLGMEENIGMASSVESHKLDGSNLEYGFQDKKQDKLKSPIIQDTLQRVSHPPQGKLRVCDRESEHDKSISTVESSGSLEEDLVGKDDNFVEGDDLEEEDDDSEFDFALGPTDSSFSISPSHEQLPQVAEKDLIMAHLLRLACSKGPLGDALPQVATELYNLGIFSETVRDLASKSSSLFNETFDHFFHQQMVSSRLSQFWKPASDLEGPSSSFPSSRYLNDFEEIQPLGHGGFGHVVLCKNKLDGRQYAVKKIRLKDKSLPDRILREVATLSRLQHQHVVRYYQAWFETGVSDSYSDPAWGSETMESSTFSYEGLSSADAPTQENKLESTYLYIQMEYCPRTLRQVFESYNHFDTELAWHLFRQIVEGLAHIHGQGIIHRDLTPNNIFFDSRNDIKIGDFGLAKFLKLEQLDQDVGFPNDGIGASIDRTGQVGTYFYTAPEIEQKWPKIDERADMYSLGVVFFELWHPFGTGMERHVILSDLKLKGDLPSEWVAEFPEQASLLRRLMSPSPSDRPSATELLKHAFPPRMEYELLDNFLRTMQSSEDTSVYDKVVKSIFDEEVLRKNHHQHVGGVIMAGDVTSSIKSTESDSEHRDTVIEVTRKAFRQHCAKHLEIMPMQLLDDCPQFNRNTVKLLTQGGDMLELCHELRLPFVNWVIANQKSSFKRYEISYVYRRSIGHSAPNRYLQGDFDIIGGTSALTEAEVIKVTMDIVTCYVQSGFCDVHLNHGDLLNAIWSWAGVKPGHVQKVAELLSLMSSLRPQSSERKSKWVVIRRQLQQELNLAEAVLDRLQNASLRFCGAADQALPRLRGALSADKATRKAFDELSDLLSYLRIWKIGKHVYLDALMPPTECYHRDLFFQIYLTKENHGSLIEGALLAVGGRYDYLLQQMWDHKYKTTAPGAVGTSLALETLISQCPGDYKPIRNEANTNILVCSKGGGGLLVERMELVTELWEENIKAEFVPVPDPSFKEQYDYADEHDMKCLITITDEAVSTGFVKVRHLELKKVKEVQRENLIGFLQNAMATQFRNPSVWAHEKVSEKD